ncbi:MAG: UDP-N-acetylmuramoyl-L-alanyl-D-glutamate--2,6-diaminopimelate ligase [Bacilli bacterium]|nr:UDP-N-acetylmuramoyl-L-alanyl-D-glutamate--2,6-diaminopimelate ligase [Acholeplasmataceae bacterium]
MLITKLYPNARHLHFVTGIKSKSYNCTPGDIFVAIPGSTVDGFDYVDQAIALGAKTIVTERTDAFERLPNFKGNIIIVDDAKRELSRIAKRFYKKWLRGITVIGITGTNGKTTLSTLTYQYLRSINIGVILIGTNGNYINDEYYETVNTTPNILEIYSLLRKAKKDRKKIKYLIMEVSSQAIKEMRVLGLEFNIVLLTNLGRDHLDYHKTIDDYKYSKGLLIARMKQKKNNYVILNRDSPYYRFYHQLSLANIKTFGLYQADYQADIQYESLEGTKIKLKINGVLYDLYTKLLGRFNVYNILAIIAILDSIKLFSENVIKFFEKELHIDGRMEVYTICKRKVIIDFAHTPEGIKEVLLFLNKVKEKRLIALIGCGGDRDQTKRPLIGGITTELADLVYFTEDNSRNEPTTEIINDMIKGAKSENYVVIPSRKDAIKAALGISEVGDIIVLLGKGHEPYMITNNVYYPYSDKEEVLSFPKEDLKNDKHNY